MNNTSKYIRWFVVSLLVFMVSIFMHECGHGIANSLAGIPCSTGFNRVGDIYKFPSSEDFRSYYSTAPSVLLDFGVPCTLFLAVFGAYLYSRSKFRPLQYIGASLAAGNGLLRFVPGLAVLLVPLFTGKVHVEDEYETGELMAAKFGSAIWTYIPAILSVGITLFSLIWILRTAYKRKVSKPGVYAVISFIVFCVGMVIASILDNYIRINWPAR